MRRRRVLVTGAAGFLGAATTRRLLADGHEVLAWVRPTSDRARLPAPSTQLQFLDADLRSLLDPRSREEVAHSLRQFGAQACVHAAWSGTRGPARDDPRQLDNLQIGLELLRLLASLGVRRFVGLGSQAEYGPRRGRLHEDCATTPVCLYGAAKAALGHFALAFAARSGLSAAWVRVFSVYGPGQPGGALLPDLVDALRQGRTFAVEHGDARWDYLFIDDAAEAISRLAASDEAVGPFNLGCGATVTIRDVALQVAALLGGVERLRLEDASGSTPRHLEADVARLHASIGWSPVTSLDEGLARTAGSSPL